MSTLAFSLLLLGKDKYMIIFNIYFYLFIYLNNSINDVSEESW